MCFALPVRSRDRAEADDFVARLLDALGGVRAFDPDGAPDSSIFGGG
jgi:hypothetical protein